jgi:small subunit ribosomal protein S2
MPGLPDAIFIIDSRREEIAVAEARRLKIPVMAVVDTNCDPQAIDHVIPGNDDALRAIRLFASRIADAILEGQALGSKAREAAAAAEAQAAGARGQAAQEAGTPQPEVSSPSVEAVAPEVSVKAAAPESVTPAAPAPDDSKVAAEKPDETPAST